MIEDNKSLDLNRIPTKLLKDAYAEVMESCASKAYFYNEDQALTLNRGELNVEVRRRAIKFVVK